MRKKGTHLVFRTIPVIVMLTIMMLTSCVEYTNNDDPPYRFFWVIDTRYDDYQTNSSAWYSIYGVKLASSSHVSIYVDQEAIDAGLISEQKAAEISQEFDSLIYPSVTQNFSYPEDVDGNGKIILLLYDIKDNYDQTGAYVGGYFYPVDFYSNDSVQAQAPALHSNEGDLIYVDINHPPSFDWNDTLQTVAHEFQHLVNYSQELRDGNQSGMDTWIDEGLAESAAHLCYGVQQNRIDDYNGYAGINKHPLFYWDRNNVFPNYAKSYLFMQYLRIQSDQDWVIYKTILDSNYRDYGAIIDALDGDSGFSGKPDWGNTSTERFERLLLRWYATNNLSSPSSTYYQYDGVIEVDPDLNTDSSVTLGSGAGFVKATNNTFNDPEVDFVYLSVNGDGTTEDFDNTYDGNGYFVAVYNYYSDAYEVSGYTALPETSYDVLTTVEKNTREYGDKEVKNSKVIPRKVDFIPLQKGRDILIDAEVVDPGHRDKYENEFNYQK